MRFITLLAFFCLNVFISYAQVFKINLSEQKLSSPITNIIVEEIIDLRYDKSKLGWVQKGMSNEKVRAEFERPFEQELLTFLKKNSNPSSQAIPVVLKINKFEIYEKTEYNVELGTTEIDIELLERKDGGYSRITDLGAVIEESSITDITGKHEISIAKALESAFGQIKQMDLSERANSAYEVGSDYLELNTYYKLNPLTIPVLASDSLETGVYKSFLEFRNNAPSIKEKVKIQKNGHVLLVKSGEKLKNVWGFSDGKTAFVFYKENYFPLQKKNEYFTFTGLVSTVNQGAVLMGGLMGGMIGGAIAGAITAETNEVNFILNMKTGRIAEAANYGPTADLAKTAKVILLRNARSQAAEKLDLYINDSLYAQLEPNSYSEIIFNVPIQESEFCIKTGNKTCKKFTPVLDRVSYFECSFSNKKDTQPSFNQISEKEALYYLKIIKGSQK